MSDDASGDEPALVDLNDVLQLGMMTVADLTARTLPPRHWKAAAAPCVHLAKRLRPGQTREALAKLRGLLAGEVVLAGEVESEAHAQALLQHIWSRHIEDVIMLRRLAQRPHWRPPLRVRGAEEVAARLARGGVMLWVAPATSAMLLAVLCAHDHGWPAHRLSLWKHGVSRTRLGFQHINPHVQKIEDRFATRIVIGKAGPTRALRELIRTLDRGGLMMVNAVDIARDPLVLDFLGGRMRLAVGAVAAALRADAAILSITMVRDQAGTFELVIEPLREPGQPLEAAAAAAIMAGRMAEAVRRDPGHLQVFRTQFFL